MRTSSDASTAARAPISLGWALGALVAVLAVRALYLARFGWDGAWMNWNHLGYAKALALGGHVTWQQSPLTAMLLVLGRSAGLSSIAALGAVYLLSHALLCLGTLAIAAAVWPQMTSRRRLILGLVIALTPLLATVAGYRNLGPVAGAGFFAIAYGLALLAARANRFPPVLLAGAATLGALAGAARLESVAGLGCGAIVLWTLGPSLSGMRRPRWAAAALLAGALAALAPAAVTRDGGGHPSANDGLYAFYDGLSYLMWPTVREDDDEFGRYRASMWYFGTAEENRGSALVALAAHPRAAILRFATKPLDLLGALAWIGSFTPLGLIAAWLGLRGLRAREGTALAPAWALLAYAGPAALLWVPAAAPPYLFGIAAPLLLAIGRGIDVAAAWLPTGRQRLLGAAAAGTALAGVAAIGKTDVMNSRALNQAAQWLEQTCHAGCVTNVLPQSIRVQAWVDLEGPAPLPERLLRAEDHIFTRADERTQHAFRFDERVRRARAAGFAGPVFWVEPRIETFPAFHPVFDRERNWEGSAPARLGTPARRFVAGPDEVLVYALGDDVFATAKN